MPVLFLLIRLIITIKLKYDTPIYYIMTDDLFSRDRII